MTIIPAIMFGLFIIIVAISGLIYLSRYHTRQDFVAQARTEWMRAGRIIHYGPVGAACYGSRPEKHYTESLASFGALALIDGHLEFKGMRAGRYNIRVPFEVLQWVGIRKIPVSSGDSTTYEDALIVHYDGPGGWQVFTWAVKENLEEFARELSIKAELPVQHYGKKREDFGPSAVTRMTQDIYGVWSKDRTGILYLAPDRLIFGWRQHITLHQIKAVNVISKGGWSDLNPFASELLQIEYADQEGKAQTTAFLVRESEKWGRAIQERTGAALDFFAGRKKKAK